MSTNEVRDLIEDHGTALDEEKKRVRCKYCAKEVGGFSRLRHHLGAVGGDVVACTEVPTDVKMYVRDALLGKRKERLLKEVGEIYHPDLPWKRNFSPQTNNVSKGCPPKPAHLATPPKGKKAVEPALDKGTTSHPNLPLKREFSPESDEVKSCHLKFTQSTMLGMGSHVRDLMQEAAANGSAQFSSTTENVKTAIKLEVKDESALNASRCIARFLYEAGVDLSAVKFPSFQRMIDAAISCGAGYKVPRYDELRGWILQEELKEVQVHVEEVKCSWGQTGCSILLDGWTDERGRNLICFLVACPKGTIFLKSVDASCAIQDVDALFSLLSGVVEEVGIQNVVQVVTHDTSCYLEAAGKKLMEKHRTLFWTVSADYCINLILRKIGTVDHVKKVLTGAKTITKFIYSHTLTLELMRKHIHGRDLVRTSKLKSVAPFITLGNMVSQKENLINMFSSATWNSSVWASRAKGKAIADRVKAPSFWAAADEVVKATIPLVGVLNWIDGGDKTSMGCIYEAMDRAKEAIKRDLGDDEGKYLHLWNIVDDIWDNYLHSSLHSAGYYLNPSLFYSSDFFVDAEVANGLLRCIIRLVEDQQKQDLIVLQLDSYRAGSGGFGEEMAVDQRTKIPPALWWSLYGGSCPELQRFAIRILSQTCSGASRYKLKRTLSEQLHTVEKKNCIEQQRLCDIEFIHYNLRLWQSPLLGMDQKNSLVLEDIDPLDDSILED